MIRTKEARKIKGHSNPEQWFVEQLRGYTQRQPRGPRTPDLPDDSFLCDYAAKPGSFSLSDARVQHVTSCGHCLPALVDLRSMAAVRHSSTTRAAVVAALCAACILIGSLIAKYWSRQNSFASNPPAGQQVAAAVDRTIDLTN